MLNLLLSYGANPKTKSRKYGTPCEYAQSCYEEAGGDVWLKIQQKLKAAIKNPPQKPAKKPVRKPAKKANGTIANQKEQSNVQKENILTIPAGTVKIKEEAYLNRTEFTGVVIPDGVTEIDSCMFRDCKNLKRVALPSGLKYIREEAFSGCGSLANVALPDSLVEIASDAFEGCPAVDVSTIPAGKLVNSFDDEESF